MFERRQSNHADVQLLLGFHSSVKGKALKYYGVFNIHASFTAEILIYSRKKHSFH